MIKIGIVGSRSRNSHEDYMILVNAFTDFVNSCSLRMSGDVHIISGGARSGADKFAEEIAKQYNYSITIYRPNYKKYFGKEAPKIRNTLIANESDYLFALWDKYSGGTEDTINKFLANHDRYKLILLLTKEKESKEVLPYTKQEYSF